MNNFTYYTPTRVIFGRESELETGRLVRAEGGSKVLVHYGGGSAVRSGLLDRVCSCLAAEGLKYVTFGGVMPNPRLSLVYEGIELARAEGVDFVLAIGGGSVIDSSKAIAMGVLYDGDIWDCYAAKTAPDRMLPVGVVLTIPATGSEMSWGSVITNDLKGWRKIGLDSDIERPRFAVMNPELSFTLPEYQTMSGITDIIMHTMERYFSHEEDTLLTDALAAGLIKTVMRTAPRLLLDPFDYDARAEIMWAGSLSHNGLTGCGRKGDWASHQMEHELGGMYDVAHGAGLAAVWGSWARYVYDADIERFGRFAADVLGIDDDPALAALKGIEAMEDFFRSIHMPTSLRELGVEPKEGEIEEMAYKCTYMGTRTIGTIKVLMQPDIEAIYRMAL